MCATLSRFYTLYSNLNFKVMKHKYSFNTKKIQLKNNSGNVLLNFVAIKNLRFWFGGYIFLFLVASCMKNDQVDYYSALGTISITKDSTIISSDEGNRLLVSNPQSIGAAIVDKDRVIANFSLVNKTLPAGIDYVVNVTSCDKILFKPVVELTTANKDSIGNDELGINSIQLVKDYLNLSFTFYGNTQKHYINLIRFPGTIRTDTVDLEIRHNNNNDNTLTYTIAFVSFDLKSLRNTVADSVILRIKAKEFNNLTLQKNYTYKY